MRGFSMTATLVAALALAGCSDGAKEVKGEKGMLAKRASPDPQARRERRERNATQGLPGQRSGSCRRSHRLAHATAMRL
jgi:hypothetical protein